VVLAARRAAELEKLADRIRARGGTALAVPTDVARTEDVEALVSATIASYGRIDVLVNNAGIGTTASLLEATDEEFERVVRTNLLGPARCARAVLPYMRDQGGGVIVNVGSMSGQIVNRPQWQPAYNASKAGVHHLTKSLAAEWAPFGVRVNAVAPGYVQTDMSPVDRPEFAARWIGDAPQQRAAAPEEIAPAVVFLASPASSFMTGTVLVIDGGYTVF
jgi:NAD(P)-dependent dehydrogenase (short-subunit alcohol dehydrogenase family)